VLHQAYSTGTSPADRLAATVVVALRITVLIAAATLVAIAIGVA